MTAQPNDGLRYLQNRLNRAGFGPLNEDGLWGPRTKTALDRAVVIPTNAGPDPEVDPILLAALKRDEGYAKALPSGECTAYPDPLTGGAPWTIGYGHTGPEVRKGLVWSRAQAEAALVSDIHSHNAVLAEVLPWISQLDAPRRRVLQNMHFNMGWDNPRTPKLEGLSGFVNTLAHVRAGRYAQAADGMAASLWARQVKSRADRLVATMRDGVDR